MSGTSRWLDFDDDTENDVSSIVEEYLLEDNDHLSFRKPCLDGLRLSDTSIHCAANIMDWIPEPDEPLPKSIPLRDSRH